ncbi:MAG: bifunctional folylpolyglutamate synthase/dihydrofolate synthase [Clostridiales bacterium]|nr:bifunctional folylpolyglutamate synthase/dihydrofolate synthase [Clostridiales bacterium]
MAMTYEETLAKIHNFDKFGSRLGLERMKKLLELLGDPQKGMKVIHVAGTNGKGSTCRYLYCMLQQAGYKVGLYTSPYLERFTERIEFNGEEISHEDLAVCTEAVLAQVDAMLKMGLESPTEFEVVTAICFYYLSKKPVDYLVLEVGMGGSGDSTNVMEQVLASVITSISYDHMQVLGNSLEEIALNKAGIIKPGCPVISHVKDPGADVIRKVAEEKGCAYYDLRQEEVRDIKKGIGGYGFTVDFLGQPLEIQLSMLGMHQIENAKCALKVLEVLVENGQLTISREDIQKGILKAVQTGRFEILKREDPIVVIDGAHNDDGVRSLVAAVKDNLAGKKILMIVGILADKEVEAMLKQLLEIGADMAATEPDNPRKLSSAELAQVIRGLGVPCEDVGEFDTACDYALSRKDDYDVILFSGSLYLIGKIRERLTNGKGKEQKGLADL